MTSPQAGAPLGEGEFKQELVGVVPHLRAFARGLCGRPDTADDLVQETMVKAWAARERFERGTSMRAWTFVILRNQFLTEMRRNRFKAEYNEEAAEKLLVTPAAQEGALHLSDLHRALQHLAPERREAVLLVGAGGLSYEAAAEICGVAVGTIKSRVARARATLAQLMSGEQQLEGERKSAQAASASILAEVKELARGVPVTEDT